jgi:8-oxo-dGTP pyrophosphatase MutT (NUDIX family)
MGLQKERSPNGKLQMTKSKYQISDRLEKAPLVHIERKGLPNPNGTAEMIRRILLSRSPRRIDAGRNSLNHAGVLIPLLKREGNMVVLFTRRTNSVEHHKGQISFPGGAVDKEDSSFQETALRETREEIGVSREFIDILGPVDDALTLVSNFLIHPYVGFMRSGYTFSVNPAEVERVLEVPLSVFRHRYAKVNNYTFEHEGKSFQAPGYEYEGNVIWGATARIMDNFMCILGDKIPLPLQLK